MPLPCFGRRIALLTTLFMPVGLCGLASPASANDCALTLGGNPQMLRGHPYVSMTSEVVKIDVYDQEVDVDCNFTFTNHGPACTVLMGFPDQGEGEADPDEEADPAELRNKPPRTALESFDSYVNGKPVKTRFIRTRPDGLCWHTKTVIFPARSTVHVRDVYTQEVGSGVASYNDGKSGGGCNQVAYILHTGASWHGGIGRSEIDVIFHTKAISVPLRPFPVSSICDDEDNDGRNLKVTSVAPNTIVWRGPCPPTVQGRTLRFVRSNWHPTDDDILLTYHYTK